MRDARYSLAWPLLIGLGTCPAFLSANEPAARVAADLPFTLTDDGGSLACRANGLSLLSDTLFVVESDCIQDIVNADANGSMVFQTMTYSPRSCDIVSMHMDASDNISIIAQGACYDVDFDDDGLVNRDDPFPDIPEPNDCSSAAEILPGRIFGSSERYNCRAAVSISTGGNTIEIGSGATVLYMAPSIQLEHGFSVTGGEFHGVGSDAADIAP